MALRMGRMDSAQVRENIFHPRRHFGVNCADDDAVSLHRAQAVRQHLLADALQVLFQLIESPGTSQQIPHDKQLPFAADHLDGGGYRTGGEFFFGQYVLKFNRSLKMSAGYLYQ